MKVVNASEAEAVPNDYGATRDGADVSRAPW